MDFTVIVIVIVIMTHLINVMYVCFFRLTLKFAFFVKKILLDKNILND
jgi:hypothetical protein